MEPQEFVVAYVLAGLTTASVIYIVTIPVGVFLGLMRSWVKPPSMR